MAVASNLVKNQKILQNTTQLFSLNYYNSIEYFEIEKQIGKGQFSEVFRARCSADNRTFALKRIRVYEIKKLKKSFYDLYIFQFFFIDL